MSCHLSEACNGLFEGKGLVNSFGLGVAHVDYHERTPEVAKRACEADVLGFPINGDSSTSVDAGKGTPRKIVGEGVDLSFFLDHGSFAV